MYRVKLFDFGQVSMLEKAINDFLESFDSRPAFKLIDIKFNSYPYGDNNSDYHSATIIYKL